MASRCRGSKTGRSMSCPTLQMMTARIGEVNQVAQGHTPRALDHYAIRQQSRFDFRLLCNISFQNKMEQQLEFFREKDC